MSVTSGSPAVNEEHVAYAVTQDVPVMSAAEKKTSHPSTVLLFSTGGDNVGEYYLPVLNGLIDNRSK